MKALVYVNIHLLKNTIIMTLKNPKLVIPALIMITLFSFPLITLYTLEIQPEPPPYTSETVKPVIFSFITFITWMTVIHSTTKNTLIFSLPEIDFLFPSPLKRKIILLNRMVINYLKMTFQYLAMSGLILFIMSSFYAFSFWPRILFVWIAIVFSMVFASNLGDLISLASSHYSELTRKRNRRILSGAAVLFLVIIAAYIYRYTSQGTPFLDAAAKALNSSVVRVFMYPMAAAADVAVAWKLTSTIFLKIIFLAALCVATTWGVLSVETHFYEASETTSRELWKSVQKMRRREVVVSESFVKKMLKISPFGKGATVLIWKNFVGILRDIRTLIPTFFMAVIFFGLTLVRGGEFYSALFLLFFLVFVTTGYIRWDFREDLRRIEIIKLIPDSNFKIVLSEIAVPCVFSTLISYLFLVAAFFIFPGTEFKLVLTGFSVVALPVFSVIMVTILNLSALYYPPPTNNQAIPGVLSMVAMIAVVMPSLLLGMMFFLLDMMYVGLTVVIVVNGIVAVGLLKLLARKFRIFDLTSS